MLEEKYLGEAKINSDLIDDIKNAGVSRKDNIESKINNFIKNFITTAQEVSDYVDKHMKQYEKDYDEKFDVNTRKLIIMKILRDGTWGNDKMLPYLAEIIALGRYVF